MNKTIIKECKYHGLTEHKFEKDGHTRCKKCAAEAVTLRRRRIKLKAVEYLGGKCSVCGYNKCIDALEFHHKDPTQKDFGISQYGATHSWNKLKKELDKCVLLCSNCHRELHAQQKRFVVEKSATTYDKYISKIIELKSCGNSDYVIADKLKISRGTVRKYYKQFEDIA